jgi:hypothetical protein
MTRGACNEKVNWGLGLLRDIGNAIRLECGSGQWPGAGTARHDMCEPLHMRIVTCVDERQVAMAVGVEVIK